MRYLRGRRHIGFNAQGYVDAAAQDAFCGNESCTVSVLYDQSGVGNNLLVAPGGCYDGGASENDDGRALEDDYDSDATAKPDEAVCQNVRDARYGQ